MKIFAHRGYSARFPESTRAAYEGAVFARADGFECDVRLTRDGEIVCFHDRTLKRNAGINKAVSRSTMKELRSLVNAISLDELLDIAIREKKDLLIETKHPVISGGKIELKVVDLLEKKREAIKKSEINVTLMSFSYLALRRIKKVYPNVAKIIKYQLAAKFSKENQIALSIDIIIKKPKIIADKRSTRFFIWTVNNKTDIELVSNLGVAGVITDEVELAKRD